MQRDLDYLRDEDRLLDIKRRYHTVVEIGSRAVDDDMMDRLVALNRDKDAEYDVEVERRVMDEEMPQFEPESLDAVVSSLSMHWVNDLPGMMIQIRKALLRTSLQLADVDRDGGIAARVSPLTDTRDMGSLLKRAGLTLSTVDVDNIIGNSVVQRMPFLKRDTLLAASAIYKEMHGNKDGTIPATFQVIYMIGWKPDPSQPQPLPRGSGEVSLGEMFNEKAHKL
ncbi:hypothetical protein DL89DRAFT_277136 [Linderina pennispora]|uniref:Methyltransferase type 11 domain-containing protein n=1 Tax=Linderina pennispora TaxID=61395 RepID=A0A1Y1WLN5_9FUNG|nr:uncharacterized protein DL89DRAFT_277136 [Linderina pennispora]ORX74275.1 hypothetical protein DL89DRAFT_277136 [Linderina pennispora]